MTNKATANEENPSEQTEERSHSHANNTHNNTIRSITNLPNPFTPSFHPSSSSPETLPAITSTISTLSLTPHIEGGYFTLTHLHQTSLPSPYPPHPLSQTTISIAKSHSLPLSLLPNGSPSPTRLLSSTIFYYLTPNRPTGSFHRNRSPIVHSLHKGRGRYALIHDNGRVETFVVGMGLEKGERCQWVVEGGVWKASFLLPDDGDGGSEGEGADKKSEGLLITETVVPGFDYCDHEFLGVEGLEGLVTREEAEKLKWLVRNH